MINIAQIVFGTVILITYLVCAGFLIAKYLNFSVRMVFFFTYAFMQDINDQEGELGKSSSKRIVGNFLDMLITPLVLAALFSLLAYSYQYTSDIFPLNLADQYLRPIFTKG